MSGARDEEIVAEARERLIALASQAHRAADAILREAANEAEQIHQQVLEATGIELIEVPPPSTRTPVHDVVLGSLAKVAESCRALLAGVELLHPHVTPDSARTVGAVLKTGVSLSDAAMAVHFLNRSGFFAPTEFCEAPEVGS